MHQLSQLSGCEYGSVRPRGGEYALHERRKSSRLQLPVDSLTAMSIDGVALAASNQLATENLATFETVPMRLRPFYSAVNSSSSGQPWR